MATHSSTFAWRMPGTEEPDRLQSIGLQRVGHNWRDLACASAVYIYMSTPISQFIPSRLPSLVSIHWFSVNVSISALQIGSTILFSYISHTCVNIWYLLLSFWLTSLCMTVSRSIHVSANGTILFFFMAEYFNMTHYSSIKDFMWGMKFQLCSNVYDISLMDY